MSLGGNSINLQALSTASDMCCHLFTNAGDTWYHYLTCSTFPFVGLQKFFQKSRTHLKIIDARRVTKFHAEDLQTLGATLQNSVIWATWGPEIVHSCPCLHYCALAPNGVNLKFQQQHLISP